MDHENHAEIFYPKKKNIFFSRYVKRTETGRSGQDCWATTCVPAQPRISLEAQPIRSPKPAQPTLTTTIDALQIKNTTTSF